MLLLANSLILRLLLARHFPTFADFFTLPASAVLQLLRDIFLYNPKEPFIFSTGLFLGVFTVFFGIYNLIQKNVNLRLLYVAVFSFFFYYKSSGVYVGVLTAGMLVDFVLGKAIFRARKPLLRKVYLFLSVGTNLGILFYFKYTNFFLETWHALAHQPFSPLHIVLPAGISFFTFQALSYTIDVYRDKIAPVESLLDYAFFVTFFPQLVAGPIVRAVDFIPQIRKKIVLSREDFGRALVLICGGLLKKTVISDYIAINFVDRIFDNPTLYSGFENLMGVYGYTLQIYCDFSGYSDMAIGIALLLGYHLPLNFNAPYQSRDIQVFWRKWHISLSTWLRDYLYIALGGNRKGAVRTYLNLFMTMLLGGLWHGANWVFILWGCLHGVALAIDRFLSGIGSVFKNPAARSLLVLGAVHGGVALTTLIGVERFALDPVLAQQFYFANGLLLVLWTALYLVSVVFDFVIHRFSEEKKYWTGSLMSGIMTFHFVAFCWIFFRSGAPGMLAPMQTSYEVLMQMATKFDPKIIPSVLAGYSVVFWLMLAGYLMHLIPTGIDRRIESVVARMPLLLKALLMAATIFLYLQMRSAEVQPFIYFQF